MKVVVLFLSDSWTSQGRIKRALSEGNFLHLVSHMLDTGHNGMDQGHIQRSGWNGIAPPLPS